MFRGVTNKQSDAAMIFAFVLLIPGYFIYHWLVGNNIIGMFLGGYTNESAAMVIAWAFLLLLLSLLRGWSIQFWISKVEILYFAFMMYFAFVVLIHWVNGDAHLVNVSHLASIIQAFAIYIVFRSNALQSTTLLQVLRFLLVVMSIFVYYATASDVVTYLSASIDDTKVATYQSLARVFLLTVVVVATLTSSRSFRTMIYLNAAVVIFLLGARSEIVGLFIYAFVFEWLLANRRWKGILVGVVGVGALLTSALISILIDLAPDSRVLMLLEFKSDGSVRERSEQIQFALDTIVDNPIFGDYGSYLALGGVGNYAHNILSVWVDLGLVGLFFMLVLFLMLARYYFMTSRSVIETSWPHFSLYALGFGLLFQTIFFMFFAKTFTDISLAVLVGVTGVLHSQMHMSQAVFKKET